MDDDTAEYPTGTLAIYTCVSTGVTKYAFCNGDGNWEGEYLDTCDLSLAEPEPENDIADFEPKFEDCELILPNSGEVTTIG